MLREHLDVVGEIKTGRDPARAGRGASAREIGAVEVHL